MLDGLEPGARLPGEAAFRLYDTHGFPLDISVDVAQERGIAVDTDRFQILMQEQRSRARRDRPTRVRDLPAMPPTRFRGYEVLTDTQSVEVLFRDGEPVDEVRAGDHVMVYLPATPFYPEGGGQVGDRGRLAGPDGAIAVEDTQKESGAIWHFGRVTDGVVRRGDMVTASVDRPLREGAMRNHTGTHLLHAALREVLGDGARQTGSLVAPDRLRFDFSHPEPMTGDEIRAVEDLVNRWILEDRAVQTVETSLAEAREGGAIAFFGDKYGERVRVVEVPGASKELCGGTHCHHTGQIGLFRIIEETGIGSGTRRVEAVTGLGALQWTRALDSALGDAASTLRTTPQHLVERARDVVEEVHALERRVKEWERAELERAASGLLSSVETVGGFDVVMAEMAARTPDEVRELADRIRPHLDVAILASTVGDRVNLTALVGEKAQRAGFRAGDLVRQLAPFVDGGGGGRADLAQAGGKNPGGIGKALATARALIEKRALQDIPS
jgi:alanyl-tRNA synthetase